ncbi:hypothetical protein RRG08_025736 [Elysia crispata]|uniref:Uncharacterized protein n=1 Tax=Elysia crispata TaxID=231223 RepID=A0AAE1AH26_9GAST|nr:hypothetical protein RRG08_025736 [Elysia crispata]
MTRLVENPQSPRQRITRESAESCVTGCRLVCMSKRQSCAVDLSLVRDHSSVGRVYSFYTSGQDNLAPSLITQHYRTLR